MLHASNTAPANPVNGPYLSTILIKDFKYIIPKREDILSEFEGDLSEGEAVIKLEGATICNSDIHTLCGRYVIYICNL